jgi:hypothetical protein
MSFEREKKLKEDSAHMSYMHPFEAIVMQRPYFQRDNDDFPHPFYDLLLAGS